MTDANAESTPVTFDEDTLARLARIKERIAQKNTTPTEAAPAEVPAETPVEPTRITGRDVDWSLYDLDFNVKHHYPNATLIETQDGPKWVVVITEFHSEELYIGNHGKLTRDGQPLNLGQYLSLKLSGNEGWKLSGIIPASIGRVAVLLERALPLTLPDPRPLATETYTPAPTDAELQAEEEAADLWAKGLTPGQDVGKVELKSGALAAADEMLAAPTTEE